MEREWVKFYLEDVVSHLAWQKGKTLDGLTETDLREAFKDLDVDVEEVLANYDGSFNKLMRQVYEGIDKKIVSVDSQKGLPSDKVVMVYSPHPDDDVIPCGGLIQRLVAHGNKVICAIATSGGTAVRGRNHCPEACRLRDSQSRPRDGPALDACVRLVNGPAPVPLGVRQFHHRLGHVRRTSRSCGARDDSAVRLWTQGARGVRTRRDAPRHDGDGAATTACPAAMS